MRILKTPQVGLLFRTFPREGGFALAASAYACFSLGEKDQGRLLTESNMWQLLRKALQPSDIFDMGFPKPGAEFLMYGRCHPAAAGFTGMTVRVQVGERSRSLQIMGPRRWQGAHCGAPEPLEPVRLDWTQAYGGPEYPQNPLGKGHTRDKKTDGLDAPQLLMPNELLTRPDEEHQPVSFAALPPFWPQRTQLLGAFDENWKYKDWPYLPSDSKAEYFFSAQPGQRFEGFFQGNEFLTIEGAHPRRQVIEGRLPDLRARIFAMTRKSGGGKFLELPVLADTLWLLPEQEAAILCYRGVLQDVEEDACDVAHLVAAWEPRQSEPLPEEHYLQQLRAETTTKKVPADEDQARPAPESAGSAAETVASKREPEPQIQSEDPVEHEIKAQVKAFETFVNSRMAEAGLTPEKLDVFLQSVQPEIKTPHPEPDLDESVAALQQEVEKVLADRGHDPEAVDKILQARQAVPPTPEQVELFFEKTLARPGLSAKQRSSLLEMRKTHEELATVSSRLDVLHREMQSPAAPPQEEFSTGSASSETPHKEGTLGYAGKDFSGADFSGRNLAYVNFQDAILEGADFSNAILVGADFSGAILKKAVFTGAQLSGTQFVRAQANGVLCNQANLLGANLSKADFSNSDFSEASLDCSELAGCDFSHATMRQITAKGIRAEKISCAYADLTEAFFCNADLRQADFSHAVLLQAVFRKSNADKAEFYAANGERVSFLDASIINSRADHRTRLRKAVLRNVKLDNARWSGADLTGARLWNVTLDRGDFSNTSLEKIVMLRVKARWANANKASIEGASLRRVNMFRGTLRKARIVKTRVQLANLFGADHYGVYIRNRRAKDSNIKRTLRERTSENA